MFELINKEKNESLLQNQYKQTLTFIYLQTNVVQVEYDTAKTTLLLQHIINKPHVWWNDAGEREREESLTCPSFPSPQNTKKNQLKISYSYKGVSK